MGKLSMFNFVTLNGNLEGVNRDISWHRHGAEENEYAMEGLRSDSILLFGRVTYEMMAGYWPSPEALKNSPAMAEGMNRAEKIVFSRTLEKAGWSNTRVIKNDIVGEVRDLKQAPGKDMTILGSGSIVTQFADAGLIDEYQIMVDPVVLGEGTQLFKKLKRRLDLELVTARTFSSGVVLLCYRPAR